MITDVQPRFGGKAGRSLHRKRGGAGNPGHGSWPAGAVRGRWSQRFCLIVGGYLGRRSLYWSRAPKNFRQYGVLACFVQKK